MIDISIFVSLFLWCVCFQFRFHYECAFFFVVFVFNCRVHFKFGHFILKNETFFFRSANHSRETISISYKIAYHLLINKSYAIQYLRWCVLFTLRLVCLRFFLFVCFDCVVHILSAKFSWYWILSLYLCDWKYTKTLNQMWWISWIEKYILIILTIVAIHTFAGYF